MHKRIEHILIALAIAVAGLYALLSFWPTDNPPPQPLVATPPNPAEQPENPLASRRRIEAGAISNLIKIGSAQLSFHGLKRRFGTMEELVRENLLSKEFYAGVIIDGYQYTLSTSGSHFSLLADPVPGPGRHFFVDETLDPRYDDNGRASSSSPYLSYSKNEPPANPTEPRASSPNP